MNKRIRWITQTAIMLALLIVLQTVTKALGQIVTGSCVNFILAQTALLCGISSAAAVAILSPIFAFMLGIGPAFFPMVPGIMAGNMVLVLLLWFLTGKANTKVSAFKKICAVVVSAFCKFGILFFLVTKVIIPILSVNEKQSAVLTASFSWPQLITALIGSSIAILVWPKLKNKIK